MASAAFDRTCSAVPALTVDDRHARNNGNFRHQTRGVAAVTIL
jgi:hypothetical protein